MGALTDKEVAAIRWLYALGDSPEQIAALYGTSSAYVYQLAVGRRRRGAGGPLEPRSHTLSDDAIEGIRIAVLAGADAHALARLHGITVRHLTAVLRGAKRAGAGGPLSTSRRGRRPRVPDETVREIRRRRAAGEPIAVIAADCGVSESYVSMVARRIIRQEVDG